MEREKTVLLDHSAFQKIETDILRKVTEVSKSLLHTFQFQLLYHTRVSQKMERKTTQLVKDYRKEYPGAKAYKPYLEDLF